jgi:hypothetical protein
VEYDGNQQFALCDEDAATATELTADGRVGFLRAAPNPSGRRTVLACETSQAGFADLAIFDARGRVVRQLLRAASLKAGEQRFDWEACDDRGAPAQAGVYFARLCIGAEILSAKLILLR